MKKGHKIMLSAHFGGSGRGSRFFGRKIVIFENSASYTPSTPNPAFATSKKIVLKRRLLLSERKSTFARPIRPERSPGGRSGAPPSRPKAPSRWMFSPPRKKRLNYFAGIKVNTW
jgi:hypothetical protein